MMYLYVMALAHTILLGLIGFTFLYYGVSCLSSHVMKREFERFGLSSLQRNLTGILQIFGGLGLLIGFFYKPLQAIAVTGISALMFLGWLVRLRIKDSFIKSLPAFFFFVLCAYLSWYIFGRLENL